MSTKRDRKHLETYFETGDRPTEEEFSELITSVINQDEDDIHGKDKKIGIGTDDPKEKLHVTKGNVKVDEDVIVKGSIVDDPDNQGGDDVLMMYNNSNVQLFGLNHPSRPGDVYLNTNNSKGGGNVRFDQNTDNGWRNNMVIQSDGKVGIGENLGNQNVNAQLQVKGASEGENGKGIIRVEGPSGEGDANLRMGVLNGSHSWVQAHGSKPLHINAAGNNTVINPGNGYVGIGTDDPKTKLHVDNNGGTNTGLRLTNGKGLGRILVSDIHGNAEWQDKTVVTSGLWQHSGANDIKNGNSGYVEIGDVPGQGVHSKLQITGDYEEHDPGNGVLRIQGTKGYSKANIHIGVNDTTVGSHGYSWIESHLGPLAINARPYQRVGIGTINPEKKLHVNGDTKFSGNLYGDGLIYMHSNSAEQGSAISLHDTHGVAIHAKGTGDNIIRFYHAKPDGSNTAMSICANSQGNVGIGVVPNNEKLRVAGKTYIGSGGTTSVNLLEVNSGKGPGIAVATGHNDVLNFYHVGATNNEAFTIVDHANRGIRFHSNQAGETFKIAGDGNITVNRQVPFLVKRYYFSDANQGQSTGKKVSDYGVAIIAGFAARDGKMLNNDSFDFFCYMYKDGNYWKVRADFDNPNQNTREDWVVDILFIRTEISAWEGGIPGAIWNN